MTTIALEQPLLPGFETRPGHRRRRATGELIVDNFAGGGGASMGIEWATGRCVDISINHDRDAVAMHAANHPHTRHLCEDVWHVDPVEVCAGRPVGLAWFSPDCKHFSKAKGGKPVSKKIRGLAWVVIRWATRVKPRVIILENVEEFQTWGPLTADGMPCPRRKGQTFRSWTGQLRKLGYDVQWKELRACDYGAPTIRKRLFLIARCDGKPIVWPAPTHGKPTHPDVIAGKLKPWRTAAECIDWSIPCPSIFDRPRPLAEATMKRIAAGVKRYVLDSARPFIVRIGQTGGNGAYSNSIDTPLTTVVSKNEHLLVSPTLIQTGYGEREGQAPRVPGLDKPLGTAVASGKHALVQAFLAGVGGPAYSAKPTTVDQPMGTLIGENHKAVCAVYMAQHNTGVVGHEMASPVSTIVGRGTQQQVVAATLVGVGGRAGQSRPRGVDEPVATITSKADGAVVAAHLTSLYGTNKAGLPIDAPAPTTTAGGNHAGLVAALLVKYYGNEKDGVPLTDPMHTIPTKDRMGLVTCSIEGATYVISDIGMRMLTPRELARAQGFPDDYILPGTKTSQVARIGNSVCPVMSEALVRANYEHQDSQRGVA